MRVTLNWFFVQYLICHGISQCKFCIYIKKKEAENKRKWWKNPMISIERCCHYRYQNNCRYFWNNISKERKKSMEIYKEIAWTKRWMDCNLCISFPWCILNIFQVYWHTYLKILETNKNKKLSLLYWWINKV